LDCLLNFANKGIKTQDNIPEIKGKAIPTQVWTGPEGSRLSLPQFKESAHEGGKFVRPTHWPPFTTLKIFLLLISVRS